MATWDQDMKPIYDSIDLKKSTIDREVRDILRSLVHNVQL